MDLREIDALIAEHVMQWTLASLGDGDMWKTQDGKVVLLPDFSSSIADAWLVVEKFAEYEVKIIKRHTEEFECQIWSFGDVDTGKIWNSIDDSASLAICLAALRSKGIEI